MIVKMRLCWTEDHSRIVPKGDPLAAETFAREGAEISAGVVEQYSLDIYVESELTGDGSGVALPPFETYPRSRRRVKR